MKKSIFAFLFLIPFFLSAQESGFHGYGDIIRTQQITTDTFELRIVFTGGNTIDGQYIVDSLKVDDRVFVSCSPYPITSISLQTSGIAIFRIWDKNNTGMPVLGSRCAVYRQTARKQFIRTNISNAMNYGISPNELNCLTQKLISQLDTIITDNIVPWTQIEPADSAGLIAISGLDSIGIWSDSLRWWNAQLIMNGDTAATLADVRIGAVNFANADLSLTGDRTHTLASNDLTLSTTSNSNTFKIDGSNGYIGINNASPIRPLSVVGNAIFEVPNFGGFKVTNTVATHPVMIENTSGLFTGMTFKDTGGESKITVNATIWDIGSGSAASGTNKLLHIGGGVSVGSSTYRTANIGTANSLIVEGRIGAGVSSPLAAGHFASSGFDPKAIFENTTTEGLAIRFQDTSSTQNIWMIDSKFSYGGSGLVSTYADIRIPSGLEVTAGNVGIQSTTAPYSLTIGATDAIQVPSGTTAQRPAGIASLLRYNTTSGVFESHNGVTWSDFGSSIYSANGDLSSDRTVGLNGYNLNFTDNLSSSVLFLDESTKYIGINNSTPARPLDVVGNAIFAVPNFGGFKVTNTVATHPVMIENTSGLFTGMTFKDTGGESKITVNATIWDIGSGSAASGTNKRLHVLGGVSIGSATYRTANIGTANSLIVEGRIGINSTTTPYSLTISGTDAIQVTSGTTGQRPAGIASLFRYNNTLGKFEGHNGVDWNSFAFGEGNNGVFSAANDNGTIPTSFAAILTDSFAMGSPTHPNLFELDSLGVLKLSIPTEENSLVISHADTVDWSNMRGVNLIIGTDLSGDTGGSTANYEGNVIIGPGSWTTGGNNNYFNTVIGYNSYAAGEQPSNTILGAYATTTGVSGGTAIGKSAAVTGLGGVALGSTAAASASQTTAIGAASEASAANAIAIGYNSTADEVGEITLGDETNNTKLTVGNYTLNIDQAVGSAQDDYIQGYNDTSGEIELRPSGLSTRGQLIETVLTSLGSLTTTYVHTKNLVSQNLSNFTATDSTLTYTGSETILVETNYAGSVFFDISTSGTYNCSFQIYVNSTQYQETEAKAQMTADGAEDWLFPFSGTTILSLSTNDVISLRHKGSTALTASLSNLSLIVKAL